MRYYHRHSFFPLVVVLLSLLLVGLMALTFETSDFSIKPSGIKTVEVSETEYQEQFRETLKSFEEQIASTDDVRFHLALADSTVASVLDLRVPAQYKDVHLQTVIALHSVKEDINAGRDPDRSLEQLQTVLGGISWY